MSVYELIQRVEQVVDAHRDMAAKADVSSKLRKEATAVADLMREVADTLRLYLPVPSRVATRKVEDREDTVEGLIFLRDHVAESDSQRDTLQSAIDLLEDEGGLVDQHFYIRERGHRQELQEKANEALSQMAWIGTQHGVNWAVHGELSHGLTIIKEVIRRLKAGEVQ